MAMTLGVSHFDAVFGSFGTAEALARRPDSLGSGGELVFLAERRVMANLKEHRASLPVCGLILLLCGCVHGGGSGVGAPPQHSVTFNISEDPHSLDPLLAQNDDEQQIARLAFDLLIDVDARGRLVPALAVVVPSPSNGGVSRDGKTITYRLRRNVLWQDGAPVTSHDVWFTWRALMDPRNDVASTRGYDLIDAIDTPDPLTAVVRLKHPWAPAVATFFTYGIHPVPIVPAHLLEGRGPLRSLPFNEHPVGSGPFILTGWERGDHLTYIANPRYFRGPPRATGVVVKEVPDVNTDLTMLRTGDLDWSLLSPAQRIGLGSAQGIRFVFAPFSGFGAMAFNCRRPPFDDPKMRRAISLAIDRPRMSRDITHGQYPVTDSDQPPFSWAYAKSVREPAFAPAAADAALDALGWRRGPDGIRRKGGAPLSIVFATFPEGDTAVRTSVFVQELLRERGIDVTIKKVTVAQFYLPKTEGGLLMSGNFDLAYLAWRTGEDPDDSDLVTCGGSANFSGYCNPSIDELESRALATPDRSRRKDLYEAVQRQVAADLPYLFLYAPTYGFAVRDSLRGLTPTPFSPTWNAYEWVKTDAGGIRRGAP
jgi:peptide/nickel transport system substrate-binding protein